MKSKMLVFALLGTMLLAVASPSFAYSPSYTYRSTVLGTDVRHSGGYDYEIVNQKSQFNSSESIYVMSRIFNIAHVDSFQFKQDLYSNGSYLRTINSPVYRPYRSWWAEAYSYVNFGKLGNGNYEVKTSLQVDGGYFKHLDTKSFNVGSYNTNNRNYQTYNQNNYQYNQPYNQAYNYNNYNYTNYNYYRPEYTYSWTHTGTSVRGLSGGHYETVASKSSFDTNEYVHALTKITNIGHMDRFKIKQELYLNGNSFSKRNESQYQRPYDDKWEYHYFWSNFGRIQTGNHEIRVYISIEDGSWTLIGKQNISVHNYYYTNNNYSYNYDYGWTYFDNNVSHVSGYIYKVTNPKTTFYNDESLVALSKVVDIRGVNTFRVKHDLYLDGNSYSKTLESPLREPRYSHWDYNYNWADFGKVRAGNHKIKVYIKVNNGSYQYLDEKNITVLSRYQYSNNYNYNTNYSNYNYPSYSYQWTQTGTGVEATR